MSTRDPLSTVPATPAPPVAPVTSAEPVTSASTRPPVSGGIDQTEGGAERARAAASTGAEKGREVLDTATGGAKEIAGEARKGVAALTGAGSDEAHRLLGEVSHEARRQADGQAERISAGLRTVAQQLSAVAAGRPVEEGRVREAADQAGAKVSEMADRLSAQGVDGVLHDVTAFARRRPGVFLAGAAVAGFVAGRMVRGAQAGNGEDGDGARPAGVATGTGPGVQSGAAIGGPAPASATTPSAIDLTAEQGAGRS